MGNLKILVSAISACHLFIIIISNISAILVIPKCVCPLKISVITFLANWFYGLGQSVDILFITKYFLHKCLFEHWRSMLCSVKQRRLTILIFLLNLILSSHLMNMEWSYMIYYNISFITFCPSYKI